MYVIAEQKPDGQVRPDGFENQPDPGQLKKLPLRKRFLPSILRRLRAIGLSIDVFVTVREAENHNVVDVSMSPYEFRVLTMENMPLLVQLEPGTDIEIAASWFDDGKLCYGLMHESRLVARMWCDLEEYNYVLNYRKLFDDEVYLFAAFADPQYRGKGLAPLLRSASYVELRRLGRTRFYSYTDFFNTAARRFKAKTGAREEALKLSLSLFGRRLNSFTLRPYDK